MHWFIYTLKIMCYNIHTIHFINPYIISRLSTAIPHQPPPSQQHGTTSVPNSRTVRTRTTTRRAGCSSCAPGERRPPLSGARRGSCSAWLPDTANPRTGHCVRTLRTRLCWTRLSGWPAMWWSAGKGMECFRIIPRGARLSMFVKVSGKKPHLLQVKIIKSCNNDSFKKQKIWNCKNGLHLLLKKISY